VREAVPEEESAVVPAAALVVEVSVVAVEVLVVEVSVVVVVGLGTNNPPSYRRRMMLTA
jgi:hypothetical protein